MSDLIERLQAFAESDRLDDLYTERGCVELEAKTEIERLRGQG